MKRKSTSLAIIDAEYPEVLTPIKLTKKDIASLTVTILGFKFIDTGYALACPDCGKISGIACREDIDTKIDWFFKFGCEHYQK